MNEAARGKGNVRGDAGIFATAVGGALAARRRAAGLTLRDLSLVSGVGIATLSKLENGAQDVRLSTVERVMAALGIDGSGVVAAFAPPRALPKDDSGVVGTDRADSYDPDDLG